MTPSYIIAGNWKMNKTPQESIDFISTLHEKLILNDKTSNKSTSSNPIEVLIIPPFTSLFAVNNSSNQIKIGAQNLFYEEKGAYTGEISPLMLKGLVDYVLIGHSERRQIFKEDDISINKKIKTALKHGFIPILCIGETLEERESGNTFSKIENQLSADLDGLTDEEIRKLVIAYEPIWAIGTGKNATPDQAQEVHEFIGNFLMEKLKSKNFSDSQKVPLILYGGSVTPQNSFDLLSKKNIKGVLVGGSSLKIDDFFDIIMNCYKVTMD